MAKEDLKLKEHNPTLQQKAEYVAVHVMGWKIVNGYWRSGKDKSGRIRKLHVNNWRPYANIQQSMRLLKATGLNADIDIDQKIGEESISLYDESNKKTFDAYEYRIETAILNAVYDWDKSKEGA